MTRGLLLYILFSLALVPVAHAQRGNFQKPDYESIKQVSADKNSMFYYPSLYKRYMNNDTTLTMREYRFLYYGSFFQDVYGTDNDTTDYRDSLRVMYAKDKLDDKDWKKIIGYAQKMFKDNPYNVRMLDLMVTANDKLNDTLMSNTYLEKLKKVVHAILSSGDGLTDSTGYFVTNVDDEYSIINILGYRFGGSQSLTPNNCDYMELEKNADSLKGLYFDVKGIFKYRYAKMFGEGDDKKEERK